MGINLLEVEVGNPATPEVTECKTCKTGRFHFYELNTKRALIQLTLKIVELAARNYEAPRPYKGEASRTRSGQPITLGSWKETQESGYLGEPIE